MHTNAVSPSTLYIACRRLFFLSTGGAQQLNNYLIIFDIFWYWNCRFDMSYLVFFLRGLWLVLPAVWSQPWQIQSYGDLECVAEAWNRWRICFKSQRAFYGAMPCTVQLEPQVLRAALRLFWERSVASLDSSWSFFYIFSLSVSVVSLCPRFPGLWFWSGLGDFWFDRLQFFGLKSIAFWRSKLLTRKA